MPEKRNTDKSFTSYISSALQNSMVTGIPQIAGAGNIPKKIIRTFVFLLCVTGFIYQSISFLNMYWEYHTVLDVQTESPRITDLPAITICNRNGLMMSKICEERPNICYFPWKDGEEEVKEFCKCNPKYCEGDEVPWNFSLPDTLEIMGLNRSPQKDIEHLLLPFDRIMDHCLLKNMYEGKINVECNIEDVLSIGCEPPTLARNVCYTMFSLIGKPDAEYEQVISDGRVGMDLNSVPQEYNNDIPDVSMQVSFHDARSLSNPYLEGFRIDEENSYIFVLRKVIKKLLPEPYETSCIDYMQKWKDRGGHGPLTEEACIQECLFKAAMEVYNCVPRGHFYPNNERACRNEDNDETKKQPRMKAELECKKGCKPACLDVRYEASSVENPYGEVFCGGNSEEGRMYVSARLENMQTTKYMYSPKYEEIEAFSYVGGYVGMWLGISLVAVFDFIETLVMILKYPFASLNPCRRRTTPHTRKVSRIHHY